MIEGIEVSARPPVSLFDDLPHNSGSVPSLRCPTASYRQASPKAPANRKSDSLSAPRSDSS